MDLHVSFNAAEAPHRQQQLKSIPAAALVDHPAIKSAIEKYEKALADEHEARLTAVQTEQDLGEADQLDALALADAIAAGKKDPGDKNRQQQLAAIQETRRHHQASVILLQRAVEGVSGGFAEHGQEYEEDLREAREALREQMGRALDEFAGLLGLLRRNSAALRIGQDANLRGPRAFLSAVTLPQREFLSPEEILEKLRVLGAPPKPKEPGVQHRRAPHQTPAVEIEPEDGRPSSKLSAARRQERMQRAAERAGHRQAQRAADDEAMEAAR
jgi:hypothetical protein